MNDPLSHDSFFRSLDGSMERKIEKKVEHSFLSLTDIAAKEFPPEQWIVQGLIPLDGITCIGGLPGVMKSYFTNYIAKCISEGTSVLERFKTQKCNILFIDKENKLSRIKDRFQRLGFTKGDGIFFMESNFFIERDTDLGAVCAFIKEHDIKLTVIDTLVRVHQKQENDASEMNKVFQALHELQLVGSAVCFLHHFNKRGAFGASIDVRDQLRGSSDILAMVDSFIALTKKENFIEVEQGKSRDEQAVPKFLMQPSFEQDKTFFDYIKEVEDDDRIESMVIGDQVYALLLRGSATRKHILSQFPGKSESTIDRAIQQLKKEEKILGMTNGGREYIYCINNQARLD